MRAVALLIVLVATSFTAGCLEADVQDGVLLCSDNPSRLCPRGYTCAPNKYCYKNGSGRDFATPRDLTVGPADLSVTDPPPSD